MSAQDSNSRELRVETAEGADGKVVLTISDNGPGVDAKTLGTIFAPFVTTKSGGTGLGLTICQSIIDAHGGTLAAAAVQPHGLEIRVTLPGAATPKHSLPS
jgi:signal transduction histidine kinase